MSKEISEDYGKQRPILSKYAEKHRAEVKCYHCGTTTGRMVVQLENNRPHFVCMKHWDRTKRSPMNGDSSAD